MAARRTAGRVCRERLAHDRWFHPGRYLTPLSSAVAREFFPEENAASKTRFPGRYSAGSHDHPRHSNVANPWDASGHEFSRFIFFPFRPSLDTTSHPESSSWVWETALEWLNGIEVKWNDRPCVIHIRVSRLASPGSRKVRNDDSRRRNAMVPMTFVT